MKQERPMLKLSEFLKEHGESIEDEEERILWFQVWEDAKALEAVAKAAEAMDVFVRDTGCLLLAASVVDAMSSSPNQEDSTSVETHRHRWRLRIVGGIGQKGIDARCVKGCDEILDWEQAEARLNATEALSADYAQLLESSWMRLIELYNHEEDMRLIEALREYARLHD